MLGMKEINLNHAEIQKAEDEFYDILFKLHTTSGRVKKHHMIKQAKAIAQKIPYLKGWPDGPVFWDIESGMWKLNIQKELRELIEKELKKIIPSGKNLSLGSGNYPYVKNSVIVDFSKKMLDSAPENLEKHCINLDGGKLPFENSTFDSCTMAFLTNYINDIDNLLSEAKRVLKKKGKLLIINYKGFTSELYAQREKNHLLAEDLIEILEKHGFKASSKIKRFGNLEIVFVFGVV